VLNLLKEQTLTIVNVDATVMTEAPKLRPWIDVIRHSISEIIQVDRQRVSVKATTSEGLGFVGAGDGMQAFAVVLLEKQEVQG
jgi:2-C-methyl-D-erythritol 2,4-cyclodiphosphate synthase